MPESNIEVFRRMLEAFDRGDRESWLAFRHPKTDILPSSTFPEADVVTGPEACWDFYVGVMEPFENASVTANASLEDLGHNQVLGHYRTEVRGRASRAVVEMDYWVLTTFRERKVLRDEWFLSEQEARTAAGVSD